MQQSNVQHDMSELFKCLCFMEMLSLSTRDHNASGVDPRCSLVYSLFASNVMVLLLTTIVGYAARLNVASWSSTTVIYHFISMLLSSSLFSSVVCAERSKTKAYTVAI